jgi:hypothetical protein
MPLRSREIFVASVAISLFGLTGCVDLEPTGPPRTENRSVELDKTELVEVELKMGAGDLNVRGGSPKLMEGEFRYTRTGSQPEVHYDASGFRGHLVVEEPSHHHGGNRDYRWDVRLNDEKPIDLEVHFGAGEGRLDVGSLTLRSLNVQMGVGELRIDLRGTPKNDYDVTVHGGVGEATIYLPAGVGVVADAKGGIGGITAHGLQKRDGRYVNDEYGHAKITVRLDVHGGIGAINLIGS